MNYDQEKFLFNKVHGLSGISIIDCDYITDSCFLTAIPDEDRIMCPYCKSKHLSKNGTYERVINDLPINGYNTIIVIKGHKYNCLNPKCKKRNIVPQYPDAFDERAHVTNRLKNAVAAADFSKETFESIAERFYISTDTVRKIFKEKLKSIDAKLMYPAPTVLGLDEVHIQKEMRFVMVDLEHTPVSLIEIAENRYKNTVINCLSRFDHPERIQYVMIDMYSGYKDAVQFVLPDAKIVVDKFHVLRYLYIAIENSRKLVCQLIENRVKALPEEEQTAELEKWKNYTSGDKKMNHYWFKKNRENLTDLQLRRLSSLINDYVEFGEIIRVKEFFLDIYRANTRADAEALFEKWKNYPGINTPSSFIYPFSELIGIVSRWQEFIFNYFDIPEGFRKTNGGTEGINSEIKRVNNNGKGYSFEILRGKLLFGNNKVKLLTKAQQKAKNGQFMNLFKQFNGMDTVYDFNTIYDYYSLYLEACRVDPDITDNADIVEGLFVGEYMRFSEHLLGESRLYQALFDAADRLDNNNGSSFYLKVPVSIKELKETIDILSFQIIYGFEKNELEEYETESLDS